MVSYLDATGPVPQTDTFSRLTRALPDVGVSIETLVYVLELVLSFQSNFSPTCSCVSLPQVHRITTARPPAQLHRLQPPTTTSSHRRRQNQCTQAPLHLEPDWRTLRCFLTEQKVQKRLKQDVEISSRPIDIIYL